MPLQIQKLSKKMILSLSGIVVFLLLTDINKRNVAKSLLLGIAVAAFLFKSERIATLCDRRIKPIYRIAGFGIGLLEGCIFYSNWFFSSRATAIFSVLKIKNTVGVAGVAVVGAILAMPLISVVLSYLTETGMECMRENRSDSKWHDTAYALSGVKAFFVLFGIYAVGISAILRANFNYIDDLGRVAEGYKAWNYGRVLSNLFATLLHMDNYLTDVSPLTQIIAAAIMALAGIVLLVILYGRTVFALIELLALTPLCLNPYFLECISYKYDAPYMALSVFGAILPLLYRKRSAIAYIAVSALGTIIVCTTYQASSGIYPMLVILLMLRMWNAQEESIGQIAKFCIYSIIGFGGGILVFRAFLMPSFDTYVSSSLPGIKDFIPNFAQNLKQYYSLVKSDFKWWWLALALLVLAGFVWTTAHTSKLSFWQGAALTVPALLCMGILCFGLYPALTEPLFAPRAMYGFGVFLTLLMVTIAEQRNAIVVQAPVVLLSWAFFVFAFTYGNALSVQKEYTAFRIEQVIEDLNDLEVFTTEEPVTVQIAGSIGHAPSIENMPQNYQMLNRLIPVNFREFWWWGQYGFYNYYKLKNVVWDSSIDLNTYDLPVIEEHMYQTIRGRDNYILVELK
jgi:hypothetical protein